MGVSRFGFLGVALLASSLVAPAALITVSLGTPCSAGTPCSGGPWVNGYVDPGPGVGNFISQVDAVPFNVYSGADLNSDEDPEGNFSASWTFLYAPFAGGSVINAASLVVALFDHDSQAAGDQVLSFTVNGNDLTADLNTLLEGSGGANFEYNIYTLALPGGVLPSLLGGSAAVSLTLQGPGQRFLIGFGVAETDENGAGVDYSDLNIDFTEPAPEPSSFALALAGLSALAWRIRRAKTGRA